MTCRRAPAVSCVVAVIAQEIPLDDDNKNGFLPLTSDSIPKPHLPLHAALPIVAEN